MRPNREDRDALKILLDREDITEWEAEFLENMKRWTGQWTERQAATFDKIWDKYEGDGCCGYRR